MIPKGIYSEKDKNLRKVEKGYCIFDRPVNDDTYIKPVATIGFPLEGVQQLEIRGKSAEEIALKYGLCNCDITYTSRKLKAPDCPLHAFPVEEAMEEYRNQPPVSVSEEEIENHLLNFAQYLNQCFIETGAMTYPSIKGAVMAWMQTSKLLIKKSSRPSTQYFTMNNWEEVDYDNIPSGTVLLLTTSKVIVKGDWFKNQIGNWGWRTEQSIWNFAPPDGQEYLTVLTKSEILFYHELPDLPHHTPSITSITIGDNNNIIDIKYK